MKVRSSLTKFLFTQINFYNRKQAGQALPRAIDRIQSPDLNNDDIQNFDQFYRTISKNVVIRENGRKKILRRMFKPNITAILENKIGKNYFQINRFLAQRADKLREEEVVFCLKGLIEQNQEALLRGSGILPFINQLISSQQLQFANPEAISGIFECEKALHFLELDSLRLILAQLSEAAKLIAADLSEENPEPEVTSLLSAFSQALGFSYNQQICQTYLIRIRKILFKHFHALPFSKLMEFFVAITKHRELLLTEMNHLVDLDLYFSENYNVLTSSDKLKILRQYGEIKYNQRSDVLFKFLEELKQGMLQTLNLHELASACKAFAQLDLKDQQFWSLVEERLANLIRDQELNQYFAEITLIVQTLHQQQGISLEGLQFLLKEAERYQTEDLYALKFMLLTNLSDHGIYSAQLFEEILAYEMATFQFKYFKGYKLEKILRMMKIFLFNFLSNREALKVSGLRMLLQRFIEVTGNIEIPKDYQHMHTLFVLSSVALKLLHQSNESKKMQRHFEEWKEESGRRLDRLLKRDKMGAFEALRMLGFIENYQVEYKEQALRFLENIAVQRLRDLEEKAFDHLQELNICNKAVLREFCSLIRGQAFSLAQLERMEVFLRKRGVEAEDLSLRILEKRLKEMSFPQPEETRNYDAIYILK